MIELIEINDEWNEMNYNENYKIKNENWNMKNYI